MIRKRYIVMLPMLINSNAFAKEETVEKEKNYNGGVVRLIGWNTSSRHGLEMSAMAERGCRVSASNFQFGEINSEQETQAFLILHCSKFTDVYISRNMQNIKNNTEGLMKNIDGEAIAYQILTNDIHDSRSEGHYSVVLRPDNDLLGFNIGEGNYSISLRTLTGQPATLILKAKTITLINQKLKAGDYSDFSTYILTF